MGKRRPESSMGGAVGRIKLLFPYSLLVDPLMWFEAETSPPSERFPPMPLTMEQSFYEFLCGPRQYHRDLSRFVQSYRRITAAERDVPFRFVPGEQRIVGRILLPLRHAKACFVLGNYLGTIALCGMVAEMAAILALEIAEREANGQGAAMALRAELERDFADLGQEDRVARLKRHGLIDKRQTQWYGNIRGARRRQLHFLDQAAPTERGTLSIYKAARGIFATTLGNDIKDGDLGLREGLIALLNEGIDPESLVVGRIHE